MTGATFGELTSKVYGEINRSLVNFDIIQSRMPAVWMVVLRTFMARIHTYVLIKNLRNLDVKTVQNFCPGSCECFRESYATLVLKFSRLIEEEVSLLERMKKASIPQFIMSIHEDMLSEFKDALENYKIATDNEIRILVDRVSKKNLQ